MIIRPIYLFFTVVLLYHSKKQYCVMGNNESPNKNAQTSISPNTRNASFQRSMHIDECEGNCSSQDICRDHSKTFNAYCCSCPCANDQADSELSLILKTLSTLKQGPQGPQGPPGLQGPSGFPGMPGSSGKPGVHGIQGPPGLQGVPGIPGKSIKGDCGPRGYKGDPGVPGLGIPGPVGPMGKPGTIDLMHLSNIMVAKFCTLNISEENRRELCNDAYAVTVEKGTIYEKGGFISPEHESNPDRNISKKVYRDAPGPKGQKGEPGIPVIKHGGNITKNISGTKGQKGEKGESGIITEEVERILSMSKSKKGEQGQAGSKGEPGLPGVQIFTNDMVKGNFTHNSNLKSFVGPPGEKGMKGFPGIKGEKGFPGVPGKDGSLFAIKGAKGAKGECIERKGDSRFSDGIGNSGTYVNPLLYKNKQSCCRNEYIAFMAGLTQNVMGTNQALPFDHVLTNEGGAYRMRSGCFVAPAAGLYVFHVHVLRCRSSGCLYIHLMKNNDIVSSGTNQDNRFETTSTSAVLNLRRGDVIWVKLRQGIAYGHTAHYSSFSGYSLRLDELANLESAFVQARRNWPQSIGVHSAEALGSTSSQTSLRSYYGYNG